ncbi:hypothetical protein VPMS16_1978 [Vibrio sp. 16]|nr:hypothetical protein VPMS16_1978 [Vibrio sp. 16]
MYRTLYFYLGIISGTASALILFLAMFVAAGLFVIQLVS